MPVRPLLQEEDIAIATAAMLEEEAAEAARIAAEEAAANAPAEVIDVRNAQELAEFVYQYTGMRIPSRRICPGHRSPMEAFADAFFGRYSVTVWKGSRGLAGKTTLLALLGHMETVLLGATVTILGGSGQQSKRVHDAQDGFWQYIGAPRHLLMSEPTTYETDLTNGGHTTALMASTRSARGPHPQRLREDEVDEIDLKILDASMGQTMAAKGIKPQTVLSSTHQYPDGTMSEVLKRATDRGWPVYEWCFRECLVSNGGWLEDSEVERKRNEVTQEMWLTEYELQEPNPEGRAIDQHKVDAMFDPELGEFGGAPGEAIVIEEPVKGATYATGADWAIKKDWTVVETYRTDVRPMKLVAYERNGRTTWPLMAKILNDRLNTYGGVCCHDNTGLGDVVAGFLEVEATGIQLVGRLRSDILSEYIAEIEQDGFRAPRIAHAYGEHKYARNADIYSSSSKYHLPDSICAGALARWAYKTLKPSKPVPPPVSMGQSSAYKGTG